MVSLAEYYSSEFSQEGLYGLSVIFSAWLSVVATVWMISLSILVWRAAPKEMDNRFMAVLLVAEGLKAAYMIPSIFPTVFDWWWLYEYTFLLRIEIFQTAHIISLLMYICFPIYFRIERLSFLCKPIFQRHAWYLPASCAVLYMIFQVYVQNPSHTLTDISYIQCTAIGLTPEVVTVKGIQTARVDDMLVSIGTCTSVLELEVADGANFQGIAILLSYLVSIFALIVMRYSMKELSNGKFENSSNRLTSRSLYIGFLGKVIGTTIFISMIFFITPMLNPVNGPNIFVDQVSVMMAEPTVQGKLFLYSMAVNGYLLTIPIAFEAMMFVHASLKDTVLGIDARLRETFGNAILTGLGALLFLIGSEAVEGLLPLPGILGGVVLGATILIVRKPLLRIVESYSSKLIVSAYSDSEVTYLKTYKVAMENNEISTKERMLLDSLADSLSISKDRVIEIEIAFDSDSSKTSSSGKNLHLNM